MREYTPEWRRKQALMAMPKQSVSVMDAKYDHCRSDTHLPWPIPVKGNWNYPKPTSNGCSDDRVNDGPFNWGSDSA
jgi:hypothetical protein